MLNDDQWRDARKQIICCILNTDMVNHFESVSKLKVCPHPPITHTDLLLLLLPLDLLLLLLISVLLLHFYTN